MRLLRKQTKTAPTGWPSCRRPDQTKRSDSLRPCASPSSSGELFPEFARVGGLLAYGPNLLDLFRLLGIQCGKVLRGEKPADLPIERPTKFELVLNIRTAKALGLKIASGLLLRADEVIE
jgi:hypothetical protein